MKEIEKLLVKGLLYLAIFLITKDETYKFFAKNGWDGTFPLLISIIVAVILVGLIDGAVRIYLEGKVSKRLDSNRNLTYDSATFPLTEPEKL